MVIYRPDSGLCKENGVLYRGECVCVDDEPPLPDCSFCPGMRFDADLSELEISAPYWDDETTWDINPIDCMNDRIADGWPNVRDRFAFPDGGVVSGDDSSLSGVLFDADACLKPFYDSDHCIVWLLKCSKVQPLEGASYERLALAFPKEFSPGTESITVHYSYWLLTNRGPLAASGIFACGQTSIDVSGGTDMVTALSDLGSHTINIDETWDPAGLDFTPVRVSGPIRLDFACPADFLCCNEPYTGCDFNAVHTDHSAGTPIITINNPAQAPAEWRLSDVPMNTLPDRYYPYWEQGFQCGGCGNAYLTGDSQVGGLIQTNYYPVIAQFDPFTPEPEERNGATSLFIQFRTWTGAAVGEPAGTWWMVPEGYVEAWLTDHVFLPGFSNVFCKRHLEFSPARLEVDESDPCSTIAKKAFSWSATGIIEINRGFLSDIWQEFQGLSGTIQT